MTVVNAWAGAVTPTSVRVVAKVLGSSARLAVADNPSMSDAALYGEAQPDEHGIVRLVASGLPPDTRFWWAIQVDGTLDVSATGTFRTHPPLGQPATFKFWAATCAGSTSLFPGDGSEFDPNKLSNHPVFDTIRTQHSDVLFGWHGGDLHYYDLDDDDATLTNYLRAYDDVLNQPRQHALYRAVPLAYSWDDHDYGPNNSDRTHVGRSAAQLAYRIRVPHYSLPDDDGGIYYTFQVGRVLFIAADIRSFRDPNTDPQSPSKTMLGSAQKAWMENILSSSSAEFFFWLMPGQWHRGETSSGADHWGSFADERNELVQMFGDLGWLDRMMVIQGDSHSLGLSTGATNPYGGFPIAQFAPLDSRPSGIASGLWDVPSPSAERGQYGIVEVADNGAAIQVSASGWTLDVQKAAHSFAVQAKDPVGPPLAPTPLPVGAVSPVVHWLSCDLVSGRIIADLTDVEADNISRLLGAYTSAGLRVPISTIGPSGLKLRDRVGLVEQATEPHRTMIVAVVNDQPAWAGIVNDRLGGTEATLELPCSTLESYLLHRYVSDHRFVQVDQATIAAALAADAGPVLGLGSGIGLEIDAEPTGVLRDREYLDIDNATVYDRLRELMAVRGGPEWTIELFWGDDAQTFVRKVFRVRGRIGVAASPPNAVFETTAQSVFSSRGVSQARYRYAERRGGGLGANVIQAYSSGEGEDQPRSELAVAEDVLAAGYPIFERRFQPSSSITDIATLNEHAARDLELRRHGQRTWEIEARWNVYPRLNIDWRIGDDIGWKLQGHRHPNGVDGQGRCIGWTLDPAAGTVRPILLDPLSNGGEA